MGDIHLEKALAINGWMSPRELRWLAVTAQKCNLTIEVGSYKGRSTRALCDNTQGIVVAIDPFNGPYIKDDGGVLFDQAAQYNEFLRNTQGLLNLILYKGTFEEWCIDAPRFYQYDFIFLDGDHRYETVKKDIENALKFLKPNGILAGHDYRHRDWPGVKQAVDEYFPKAEIIDSIWATQKC